MMALFAEVEMSALHAGKKKRREREPFRRKRPVIFPSFGGEAIRRSWQCDQGNPRADGDTETPRTFFSRKKRAELSRNLVPNWRPLYRQSGGHPKITSVKFSRFWSFSLFPHLVLITIHNLSDYHLLLGQTPFPLSCGFSDVIHG